MTWAFRVVWASLPFAAAPALARLFSSTSRPVQLVGSTGLWLGWIVVLTASLVPTTVSLTVVRLVSPAAVVAAFVSATRHASTVAIIGAVAATIVAGSLAYSAEFGGLFVQGSAYGDETRFPLRPPGPLVVGPLPLAWALVATAMVSGPLLMAARSYVLGAVISALGVTLA